jgi:hypothetical protein
MKPELSRAAAKAIQYLRPSIAMLFVQAVEICSFIDDVIEPYREWIIDPDSIPMSSRNTRHGGTSNQ